MSRLLSTGTLIVNGEFDEVTSIAPLKFRTTSNTVFASEFDEFTGAPVVDSSLKLWLDAGQTTSYSGSGSTWTDLSGNGNNGTIVNSPTYSTDNGGYFSFGSGGSQRTSFAYQTPVQSASTAFTWNIWVYPVANQDGYVLMGYRGTTPLQFYKLTTQKFEMYPAEIFYLFTLNVWQNICVTYDGTQSGTANMKMYVNGIQVGLRDADQPDFSPSTMPFYVGGDPIASEFATARISQVMVYDRALSTAEIVQNYNALQSRYELSAVTATQMPVVQRQQSSGTLLVNGEFEEYDILSNSNTFTTNDLFVVPAGVTSISAVAVGGGGGGGGVTDGSNGGGGGGGGALAYVNSIAVTPGETLTVVVGAIGAGGAGLNVGTSGGLSSIARSATILLQANGGTRGNCFAINGNNNGGAGGIVVTGSGGAGGAGGAGTSFGGGGAGGAGGYSGNGGGGGLSGNQGSDGTGGGGGGGYGANSRGGGGGGVGINGVGSNGTAGLSDAAPGSGGSNGSSGTTGALTGIGGNFGGGGGGGADVSTGTGGNGAGGAVKIFYNAGGGSNPTFPALLF